MTDEKKERIKELEEILSFVFGNTRSLEERHEVVSLAIYGFVTGDFERELDREDFLLLSEYKSAFYELGKLYNELVYNPDEDEKTLSYLFRDGMSVEDKLKALSDAWWYATNSGYSDAMANRLMAGEENAQTERWEENCRNKDAIDRYYNYLKESLENA